MENTFRILADSIARNRGRRAYVEDDPVARLLVQRGFSGSCRDAGAGLVPAQGNHEGCPYAWWRVTAIPNEPQRVLSAGG